MRRISDFDVQAVDATMAAMRLRVEGNRRDNIAGIPLLKLPHPSVDLSPNDVTRVSFIVSSKTPNSAI
jgi:hypothetical protein